ncbi:MAG: single-stranded DNA-binding protein [Clostridia bacterium]|nr:single-stranded DNA-binding protein [Clostridia bacterium]
MANFNLNRVILGGRLTSDVELRTTPNGVSVCSFTIAVNRRFQSRDSQDGGSAADFINCVAWRQQAEFITKYFHKGSSICVEGAIQTRSWTDNNNQKRYATDVVVDSAMFVDSKSESGARPSQDQGASDRQPDFSAPADLSFDTLSGESDLPF